MHCLNAEQVRERLRSRMSDSIKSLAAQAGVSPQHVGDVLAGRRDIGPTLLDFLGLQKTVVVTYSEKEATRNAKSARRRA